MDRDREIDASMDSDGTPAGIEELQRLIDEKLEENSSSSPDLSRISETRKLVKKLEDLNAVKNFPQNDLGTARLLAELSKEKCRYSPTVKDWMYYSGDKWERDPGGMRIKSMCKSLADAVLSYAIYGDLEGKGKEDYMKYAFKLSSSRARSGAVIDSEDINSFTSEEMDADDYIFNALNCTLDLRTDPPTVREHNPDDLLSKVAGVEYDPEAACPLWEKSLEQIMEGSSEKINYLQKLLGYCLTGDTSQEEFYFFFGSTSRNGKSTITETVLHILGDYGETINPETLAIKPNRDSRTASPDLAKLAGARIVVASEPPKRMLFDSSLAKTLTGRDRITARYLHENEFSFYPKFKLVFNCNSLPSINDQTVFMSERVRVIEFNRHFSESEQDKQLKNKLKAEGSGILNWMLKGLQLYRKEGLDPPASIRGSTQEYAEDSDKLGKFLDECLEADPGRNCKGSEAYRLYEKWTEENGLGTESKSNFFGDLKSKGLLRKNGTVDGVNYKNVISGYSIHGDSFRAADPDEDIPFD